MILSTHHHFITKLMLITAWSSKATQRLHTLSVVDYESRDYCDTEKVYLLYSFIILAYIGKIYTYFMIDCLSKAGYVVLNRVTNYHLWNLSSITWLIQPKVWYTPAKLFLILRSRLLNKGWTSETTTTLS